MLGDCARTESEGGPAGLSAAARRDLLLLGLTWAAGFVDAVSYLGLGNVFTANMTGNTMLLGIALVEETIWRRFGHRWLWPAFALVQPSAR